MRAGVRPRRVRDVSAPVRSAHLHLRALALERRRHRARPAGSSRRLWARDALRAAREPGRLRREARRTSSYRPAGHWRRSARPFFSALSAATRERISARRAEALTPVFDRQGRSGGGLPPAPHSFDTRAAPRRSSVRARLAAMPAVPAETLDDLLSRLDDESDLAGAPARAIPRVFSAAREATPTPANAPPSRPPFSRSIRSDRSREPARVPPPPRRARPLARVASRPFLLRVPPPLTSPSASLPPVSLPALRAVSPHQPARRRARRSRP
jgi:hypothetical protein